MAFSLVDEAPRPVFAVARSLERISAEGVATKAQQRSAVVMKVKIHAAMWILLDESIVAPGRLVLLTVATRFVREEVVGAGVVWLRSAVQCRVIVLWGRGCVLLSRSFFLKQLYLMMLAVDLRQLCCYVWNVFVLLILWQNR